MQLNRGCSGSILQAIKKDELKKMVLRIINDETQEQIKQYIRETFWLREQANHLLNCAKKSVEIAIEQDEKSAIKWLDSQIYS